MEHPGDESEEPIKQGKELRMTTNKVKDYEVFTLGIAENLTFAC
jgi:hypothetical protein